MDLHLLFWIVVYIGYLPRLQEDLKVELHLLFSIVYIDYLSRCNVRTLLHVIAFFPFLYLCYNFNLDLDNIYLCFNLNLDLDYNIYIYSYSSLSSYCFSHELILLLRSFLLRTHVVFIWLHRFKNNIIMRRHTSFIKFGKMYFYTLKLP